MNGIFEHHDRPITVNLNLNAKLDAPELGQLVRIEMKNLMLLRKIYERVSRLMTTEEATAKLDALFAAIGDVATTVATLKTELAAALEARGIPAADEAALFGRVDQAITQLGALKADPPAPVTP